MNAMFQSATTTSDAETEAMIPLPPMPMPASARPWRLRAVDENAARAIAAAAACSMTLARILAARGVTASAATRHLNPSLRDELPDPFVLVDMDRAAARLAAAVIAGERCGVFGDYDVDGTTGAAILKLYFKAIGAPLDVRLPDRILDGYGPNIDAFRQLKDAGVRVVMTVDCGAAAHVVIDAAAAEGLDVIVLDHHQMDGPPPSGALATVNPNRLDDHSGLVTLSAAGVAFMAVVALNRALRDAGYFAARGAPDLMQFLDLVALGLVCDVMPMTGLARTLTAQGLKTFNKSGNAGLRALGAKAGASAKATVYDFGFLLGPRINAAGRIGHARLAFELLTTDDTDRRLRLADQLHVMNAERQAIESDVLDCAVAAVEARGLYRRAVIVAAGEGWHPGVVGIVAGRLKERYDKPAIVIGIDDLGVGKGSARSIAGVDIGAAIRAGREAGLLIAGGGHQMAAGVTIDASAIDGFSEFLETQLGETVVRALSMRSRLVDAVIAPSAVSAAFADMIERGAPFGPDNPEPSFVLAHMRVERLKTVGRNHLACDLLGEMGERVRAIAFRAVGEPLGELLARGGRLHLAGKVKADDFRGGGAGQFQIADAAAVAG